MNDIGFLIFMSIAAVLLMLWGKALAERKMSSIAAPSLPPIGEIVEGYVASGAPCCFHPIFEGVVPVSVDLASGQCLRVMAFSKMDKNYPFSVRYRCCRCERKITRTWGAAPLQDHPGEVEVQETTPEELRWEACPGKTVPTEQPSTTSTPPSPPAGR